MTAVRDGPDAGDARGREVCALRALEAKAAGYTSLVCTDGRASVEKLLAPLSLQLRVQCQIGRASCRERVCEAV